jgi:hypothetical protein
MQQDEAGFSRKRQALFFGGPADVAVEDARVAICRPRATKISENAQNVALRPQYRLVVLCLMGYNMAAIRQN